MNFLQPWILFALPLISLPIIIHLINRNRHRSVQWAAMMFLVNANRMNKGMARLRYLLIMLLRMAAVAAIIFAVSRPLVGGPLGGLGWGKPDATLILLDRSVSMEAQDLQSGESKRSTALKKLAELLEKRNYGAQLILIDSATGRALQIESPEVLLDLPTTEPTATSANIPAMLEEGIAYLKANEAGRADVWICSDLSENDWDTGSGRWTAIHDQFVPMKGVQHFLLSYADEPPDNLSIRVANVKYRRHDNQSELLLDVLVKRGSLDDAAQNIARTVPVEIEINKVSSVVDMELDTEGASLLGHSIPIDKTLHSGWGSVTLPGDSNPLDNKFYFVFSEPRVREAVIVTDDAKIGEAFRLGLSIPMESGLEHNAVVVPPSRVGEIDWESTALLVWQAPLPDGLVADQVERFVDSGRVAMFFPPGQKGDGQLFDSRWGDWKQLSQEEDRKLSWWRGDADLLAHVGSGDALPLDDFRAYRYCPIEKPDDANAGTPLATLGTDKLLLMRAATDHGGVYFCSTLPTAEFSSLERDAVSFYVMLQRAITEGSRSLSAASQRDANAAIVESLAAMEIVAPATNAPTLSERGLHAGVYRDGDYWTAINRGLAEDDQKVAAVATVDQLFDGLSYQRINDAVGNTKSLASEIWRILLVLMALALILEAILCLPEKRLQKQVFSGFDTPEGATSQETV